MVTSGTASSSGHGHYFDRWVRTAMSLGHRIPQNHTTINVAAGAGGTTYVLPDDDDEMNQFWRTYILSATSTPTPPTTNRLADNAYQFGADIRRQQAETGLIDLDDVDAYTLNPFTALRATGTGNQFRLVDITPEHGEELEFGLISEQDSTNSETENSSDTTNQSLTESRKAELYIQGEIKDSEKLQSNSKCDCVANIVEATDAEEEKLPSTFRWVHIEIV